MRNSTLISRSLFTALFFFSFISSFSQTTYDWLNTAPDGNWRQGVAGARWNPGGLFDQPPYGILRFNNNNQLSMNNNVTGTYDQHKIIFGSSNSSARTIVGNTIRFADFGGTWPFIRNESSATHTINTPLVVNSGGTWNMELDANAGSLVIGGTISHNTSKILYVYGNNTTVDASARFVRLGGIVSGNGTFNVRLKGVARFSAAHTYTGQTQIDDGELFIETGGDITASSIFVGNSGQLTNVTKFWLSNGTGGTNFSRSITVNNGNAATRVIGGLNTSGTNTYSGGITNNSTTGGLDVEAQSGGTVEFSGVISGSGFVTKTGAGTVVFSGSGQNTYNGATTVATGTLVLNKSANIRAVGAGNPTINSGATLRTDATNQLGGLFLTNNGTFNLNNTTQTLALQGNGSVTLGSGTMIIDNTGTDTYSGTVSGTGSITKQNSGTHTFSGILSHSGGITATGTGVLNLNANNTFSGGLNINNGTVVLGNAGALNSTTPNAVVLGNSTNSGILRLNGSNITVPSITVSGTGTSNFVENNNATAATFTIANTTDITFAGVMRNGATGTMAVTKSGAGSLTLSGVNTYTGTTTISGGTVVIGVNNALPVGPSVGTVRFATGTPTLTTVNFSIGTTTAAANSAGVLDIDVNTTINLGTTNTLYFKASGGQTWDATTITINNWTGSQGGPSTGPRIFVGSDATGLTAAQLLKITFTGFPAGAKLLSTGELVPGAPPVITVTGTLSNFGSVCTGQNSAEQTYTVSADDLNADVVVTAPTGFQVSTTSGSGFGGSVTLGRTGSDLTSEPVIIYVRFSPSATGAASGNITHTSTGATTQNQAVAGTGIATPATPGTITGPTNPCASSTGNAYSIVAVAGATSYTWTVPSGWNITAGSGTNSITVTAGTAGGNITVTATNTCGTSSAQTLAVTVNNIPATPGTITGSATVCPSSANTYSIAAVPGATSYTWTLPGGWTGTSTTNSINTTAGTSGGTISVTANNVCGSSAAQTLAVTVSGSVGGTATASDATVCPGGSTTITLGGQTGTIQWQRSTNGGSTWNNIAGATSSSYVTAPQVMTTSYRAVVTNGSCAAANSTVAEVQITSGSINTAEASNTAYNSGWANSSNDGTTGFGAWTLSPTSNNSFAGFFTGSSNVNDAGVAGLPNINTGSRSWAMYSNSSNTASAVRNITGNLSIGQTISFSMDLGSVKNFSPTGTVGMGLQNSTGNNLLELYFVGGNTNLTFNDGTGTTATSIPFTRGGVEVSITLATATTYTVRIVRKENGVTQTVTRTLFNPTGGQVPSRIRFFSFNAGNNACCGGLDDDYNFYINSLSITNPVITAQPSTGTQSLNLGINGTPITVTASGTGLSYQWYRNTTNSNSGGTAVGTNAASHTPNETVANTYFYYVTVTGACGTATSSPSGAITVNNTNVWQGGTGNWNVGGNWSSGSIPTGDQAVEINTGTPTLNVPFTVTTGSLTINSPATFIIGASGRLSKTGVGGTINFNGRPVTIASISGGSGAIGEIQGSVIAGATAVTVERYIPARRAWRALTTPLAGGSNNSIFGNWQNTAAGTGVTIWSPAPNGVASPSSLNSGLLLGGVNTSILQYSSANNNWTTSPITNTNTTPLFVAESGNTATNRSYMVFVTGPFSAGVPAITGAATATTLRPTGTLQTGQVDFTGLTTGQFHFIGNPYPSPVNLSLATVTGTNGTFYVWDANGGGLGVYRTWNGGNWLTPPTGSSYGGAPIVQSGQAFFVNATSTASVTFNEDDKVSNSTNNAGLRPTNDNDQRLRISLNRIVNNVPEERDAALVRYDQSYNPAVDNDDIVKFPNFSENLSFYRSQKDLVIERRSMLQPNDTLFLRLWNTSQASYQFVLEPTNLVLPSGTTAVLQDQFLNSETVLNPSGSNTFNFTVTSAAASSGQRFRIVFRPNVVTPVRDLNSLKGISVYPNPVVKGSDLQLQFRNTAAGRYELVMYSVTGVQVLQRTVVHAGGTAVQKVAVPQQLAAGTYVAELTSATGAKAKLKITIQ
jgi:autotransporter-associated beta strand protein